MPPMRRSMRRTARRTSRRTTRRMNAMNNIASSQQVPQQEEEKPMDPKDILANRLANGEISPEEYKAAIEALG